MTDIPEPRVTIIGADGEEYLVPESGKIGVNPAQQAQKQELFLRHYAEFGVVAYACRKSGVSRNTTINWRRSDPLFAHRYDEAREIATEVLEAEAVRRAFRGYNRPAIQSGKLVGYVREYSDILLMFLLKARKPETYRDRYDIRVQGTQDFVPLSELLAQLPEGNEQEDAE